MYINRLCSIIFQSHNLSTYLAKKEMSRWNAPQILTIRTNSTIVVMSISVMFSAVSVMNIIRWKKTTNCTRSIFFPNETYTWFLFLSVVQTQYQYMMCLDWKNKNTKWYLGIASKEAHYEFDILFSSKKAPQSKGK